MGDSTWRSVTLGEIAGITTGKLDSNAAVKGGKYPFFTCSPETLSIDDYAFDADAVLLAGNNANGIFSVKYYEGKFNAYQRTYVITARDPSELDIRYLYYQLLLSTGMFRNLSIGSATRFLTLRILDPLGFQLPPLAEQRQIAAILGTLDDKIELNRRMNETLVAMAQAIFKSWFVDFDPVRVKAEGKDPTAPVSEGGLGLPPDIADLFPDSFEDSELGEIPAGWSIAEVGDISTFEYGKPLKADTRRAGSVPVYGSNGLVGYHDKALVAGPGVVVGRKGNPGTVTWVDDPFFPIDTTFYVVIRNSKVPLVYWHLALDRLGLSRLSADSAVPGLNRNIAYMERVLIPKPDVLRVFCDSTEPIRSHIRATTLEVVSLAALRDALLPKLISGELRVPDAEKFLQESGI